MNKITIGVGHWECSDKERQLINEVLDSGRLSYGPMSKELERQFAKKHGCEYGVLSNSGTSSLQVALQAMKELHGWRDGTEVIVPATTFVATANIVLHNRLTPVLVDVDRHTYNISVSDLDRVEDPFYTKAVIPVHLFGQPADVKSIKHEYPYLKVIEDSCESMGAHLSGDPVGSLGDIGCFSFYVAHLLTTGVGGMATTNNPDYAAKMRSLVNHGRDGIFFEQDEHGPKELVSRRFKFDSVGHSFRITELEAALGLAQLDGLDDMIATRRKNAAYLSENLAHLEDRIQLPVTAYGATHSFMMYPIVMHCEEKWDLCEHLESHGIETREMLPLINQPCYRGFGWNDPDKFPVANWINRSGFYIGCHQYLKAQDLQYMVAVIDEYFET